MHATVSRRCCEYAQVRHTCARKEENRMWIQIIRVSTHCRPNRRSPASVGPTDYLNMWGVVMIYPQLLREWIQTQMQVNERLLGTQGHFLFRLCNHGPVSLLCLWDTLQHTATHCNTLQHTATHCSTLQHTAAHCNTLQHPETLICLWDTLIYIHKSCQTCDSDDLCE